jgi:hypothetical protein
MERTGLEEWKPVSGYEGKYEVSSTGQVRSLDRVRTGGRNKIRGVLRKPFIRNGYLSVVLFNGEKHCCHTVHRMVIESFTGKKKDRQINHKDGNKKNNSLYNLEWVTPKENMKHAYANNLINHYAGERSPNAILTEGLVREIRKAYSSGKVTGKTIALKYGINRQTAMDAITRRTWRSVL